MYYNMGMDGESIFGSDVPLIEGMRSEKEYSFPIGTSVHLERGGKGELIEPISAIRLRNKYGYIRIHNLQGWQSTTEGTMISGESELHIAIGTRFGAHVDDARK